MWSSTNVMEIDIKDVKNRLAREGARRRGSSGPYDMGGTWPHQPEAHIISPSDVVALPAFSFLQRGGAA